MRYDQTPMPPTPQSIMRKANTSRIARSLGAGGNILPMPPTYPGPALLGPPIHQPPQTDPFTPGITPSSPPQFGGTLIGGGPPGVMADPSPSGNPALMSYEALMRSAGPGLRAAQPMLPPKPMAGGGADPIFDPIGGHTDPFNTNPAPIARGVSEAIQSDPQLPGDPGGSDPGIIPDPLPGTDPGNNLPPGYATPHPLPPDIGPHDDDLGIDPSGTRFNGGWVPRNLEPGLTHGRDIDGNPVNPGTFNQGPHTPGNGGPVGVGHNSTPQEPWYGRVARSLMPYGTGQIAHMIAEYARRHGSGTVGGAAHVVGRNTATGQPGANAGPAVTPTHAQPGTHFDFTRGQYVHDNYAGGAQNNTQAANAMLMWSQNIHQPTNLRQSDEVSRFLTGGARRMVAGGGFDEQPTGRSGYSGTTGNPTLTTDPRAIAAYNAYVANRGR